MKTPLPRPLTQHQWRRLVKLYRWNLERRKIFCTGRHWRAVPLSAAIAWEDAKETLFPLNFP
jgi:hypothetical protein